MPNWCSNTVVVRGSKTEISRFKKFVERDGVDFSFESILPMPSDLRGTSAPTTIVSQEDYDAWMKTSHEREKQKELDGNYSISMEELGGRPLTRELSQKYLRLHGNDNWYDWAWDNWGTKWELNSDELQAIIEPDTLKYYFATAWNPPYGIYRELKKRFPKLIISWIYMEEGMGKAGDLANEPIPERESARDMNERIARLVSKHVSGNEAEVNTYS